MILCRNEILIKNEVTFFPKYGNSPNVLKAIEAANSLNCFTIGLTGRDGGKLKDVCNETIIVPSNVTARIQETHILIGHILCDMVDTAFN